MSADYLTQNWALAAACVLGFAILLFVLYRLYEDSGQGQLAERVRELNRVRAEAAAAASRLQKARARLVALQRKADSTRPRVLSEAEEAVQDADALVTITGDQVMRAEKVLRDVILEEFPPNRQDVLRKKYL